MKSRTSFFDKTVLKKDLTRFFPLWALYLIGGLLIMHVLSGFYGSYFNDRAYSAARDLNSLIGPMGLVNMGYAFLAAQLLFGDLHNTRLCYGVHALPLRREGWYLTHTVSGLMIGFVPPLVIVITLLPVLGRFWFVGLLCWGALALHYLFFFGLASLCMMLTGNRFAATAVYGILNFLSLLLRWFVQTVYLPLLPGVRINTDLFDRFCPPVTVTQLDDFFLVTHSADCDCKFISSFLYDGYEHSYIYQGLGGDWGYLWILAGVGVALLAGGLLLYRIRHLERAGDFMAFKPMKPIFLGVYSLCVGAVLFYLAYEIADEAAGYFFFVIGLFIGYFTGKMLLERTLRVFKGRSWVGLGILYGAVALSLLLTWADPMGIARRIPKADKVEVIYLHDGKLSDYQLGNPEHMPTYSGVLAVTEPEHIAEIRDIHRTMLEEHKKDPADYHWFTIQYKLRSGATVSRSYRIYQNGPARNALKKYLTKTEYLFGAGSLEELQQKVRYLYCSELGDIPESGWPSLLEALWLDSQAGKLSTFGDYGKYGDEMVVELQTANNYRTLFFGSDAYHTMKWLKTYTGSPELILQHASAADLASSAYSVQVRTLGLFLGPGSGNQTWTELMELLWQDCLDGKVSSTKKWPDGLLIEITSTQAFLYLTLASDSQSAQWLNQLEKSLG